MTTTTRRMSSLSLDSSSVPKPLEWLGSVTGELDRLGCRWVVAGAAAAVEYRLVPRYTTDLDLLVTWDSRIPEEFKKLGYDVRQIASSGESPHLVSLRRDDQRVDLIISVVPYQQLAIERGESGHVLTVEDVIIHKLIAWRPRDRDDIASILAVGHDIDLDYVDHWASEWDVSDRWDSVRPRN